MRTTLLEQILERRRALKIRSSDMPLLAGINRQQYEKIEKGGNPSLVTLDKISEGLDAELMLIPKEKMNAVRQVLTAPEHPSPYYPAANAVGERITFKESFSSHENHETFDHEQVSDPWVLIEEGKRRR